ncbi:MAG: GlsB/YeaQ/YmgE family stress response membrane protein [Flavobacteriaceae bacterium]|nr:GlsB/YeaQ/YmgE family stress response membrane protein [Flavobacteriaceae bacterium]
MEFLYFIIIGAIAGWLAGTLMKGGGYGFLINAILGIIGGVFGGWLFGVLGISLGGDFGPFITAVVGAIVIIVIAGLFKK